MSAVCQCISPRKHKFSLGEIYPTDEKAGDDNNWVDDTTIMAPSLSFRLFRVF